MRIWPQEEEEEEKKRVWSLNELLYLLNVYGTQLPINQQHKNQEKKNEKRGN